MPPRSTDRHARETVTLTMPSLVVRELEEAAGDRQWPFERLMMDIISNWLSRHPATDDPTTPKGKHDFTDESESPYLEWLK